MSEGFHYTHTRAHTHACTHTHAHIMHAHCIHNSHIKVGLGIY